MSELRHIATALIDALPEESLRGLVRRLAPYVGVAPQLMTRKTAARYLDMSESSLRRLEAMVPPVQIEGFDRPMFRRADLDRFIRSLRQREEA